MKKPLNPVLVIVVPCYNEEEVLPATAEKLSHKIERLVAGGLISQRSALLFVDDGSSDNTWALIEKYHSENPAVVGGIKLSANRGQQNALLCGLFAVKNCADAVVAIDADLQDDIDAIDRMLEHFLSGAEIVYGVRSNRLSEGFFKRICARFFYRFMRFLGARIVANHAHFLLMGRKALDALAEYSEVNLFMRGIVPMLGYKTAVVDYELKRRSAGKSKYSFRKLLELAFEGIASFSTKPLRFITLLGVLLFTGSLLAAVYLCARHFSGLPVSAWAGLACSVWGVGGLVIFSVGVAGEYIGKIYAETKRRPRYHIEQVLFPEGSQPASGPGFQQRVPETGEGETADA